MHLGWCSFGKYSMNQQLQFVHDPNQRTMYEEKKWKEQKQLMCFKWFRCSVVETQMKEWEEREEERCEELLLFHLTNSKSSLLFSPSHFKLKIIANDVIEIHRRICYFISISSFLSSNFLFRKKRNETKNIQLKTRNKFV